MGVNDIKSMYEKMYNSQYAELERQKRRQLEETDNRSKETELKYQELLGTYNNQKSEAKDNYYNQRDDVSLRNAKQVNQTRDYMAKNNLLQSGESVDAMLRNNSNLNNSLGEVRTNEANTMNSINTNIGNAEREKAQKMTELMNYRNGYLSDWDSQVYGLKENISANAMKDINAYNEQLRREAVAQQQAAARAAASRSAAPKEEKQSKESFMSDFKSAVNSFENHKAKSMLDNQKEEIISAYGKSYYDMLYSYWSDSVKETGPYRYVKKGTNLKY